MSEPVSSSNLVLISFTNSVASPESLLAVVDLRSGYLREIDFHYDLADFGATGIARLDDDDLLVGLVGSKRLVRLSSKLEFQCEFHHDAFDDLHSVTWIGNRGFAIASGLDGVVEFRMSSQETLEIIDVHYLSGSRNDSIHVNSVCCHDGRIWVSTFGPDWRQQKVGFPCGQILDLGSQTEMTAGLSHPHSLCSTSQALYVLGSYSGTIECVDSTGERSVCARYPGYLRGLRFFDGGALVGVSARRRRSRGLGTTNMDDPRFEDRSGLLWFDKNWQLLKFLDLTWFGREVFDVLCLDQDLQAPTVNDTLRAAKHRSLQLEASWEAPPGGPLPPDQPIGYEDSC